MQHHPTVKQELTRTILNRKIPNALLFSGPPNSGRKEAAFWFVSACNCTASGSGETNVCGTCQSCRKIAAGSHPDIHSVKPESGKKTISISQIRQINLTLAAKPNEALYRMVLVEDAHLMNVQAQNALLKMLEEPPAGTFFILISHLASSLLPTILSRCRVFVFKNRATKTSLKKLIEELGQTPEISKIALETAENDFRKAQDYLTCGEDSVNEKSSVWYRKRKWLLLTLFDIVSNRRSDPARAIQKGLSASWQISREPDFANDLLAIIKTFIRDLMICRHHPQKIVNLDFFVQFEDSSEHLSKKQVSQWSNFWFETEKKLSSNSNLRLTLDSFFLKLI